MYIKPVLFSRTFCASYAVYLFSFLSNVERKEKINRARSSAKNKVY